MKDKGKQEKAKMFQEVAEDKMAEGKDTTKEKKGKEGKTKQKAPKTGSRKKYPC